MKTEQVQVLTDTFKAVDRPVTDHFADASKMVRLVFGSTFEIDDLSHPTPCWPTDMHRKQRFPWQVPDDVYRNSLFSMHVDGWARQVPAQGCQKRPRVSCASSSAMRYIPAIRPLAVSPLDHHESEPTPWGFFMPGRRHT